MVKQAKTAATRLKKGAKAQIRKVHTRIRFFRKPTKGAVKNAAHAGKKKVINVKTAFKGLSVLKKVVSTEKCMGLLQKANVITFIVDNRATKESIKEAFSKLYDAKVKRVNTLILPDGKKKAYLRLHADSSAINIANKMGII